MLWKSSPQNKVFKIVGGISREKGAHPRKVLCLRSSEGNLCIITTHLHYPCPNKGNFSTPNVWFTIVFGEALNQLPPPLLNTCPLNIVVIIFTYIICPWADNTKTVNLVKMIISKLGNSSLQKIEFKIMWGEPLDVRKFIHTKHCAWNYLRGTPSYPYPH